MELKRNIDVIKRRSNSYNNNSDKWNYFMASYIGGESYKDFIYKGKSTLIPHNRELDIFGKYESRKRRAYYLNYCKFVVDTYSKFIFSGKNDITRIVDGENNTETIEDYIYNIDGRNNHVDAFMEKLFRLSLIYGEAYIFVDKSKSPEKPLSELEAKQMGYRAYCKILTPLEVMDYSLHDSGEYRWILLNENYIDNSDPFKEAEKVQNYRLITEDEIILYDEDGNIIEQMSNSIKYVPVIKCVLTDMDSNGVGESLLKDIVRINNEIYNISSMVTEDFVETCFPLMYGPEILTDDKIENPEVNIRSTQSYIQVQKDAVPPGFIAPPTSTLEIKLKYVDTLIMEILRLAGLQKDDAVQSSSQSSGISKAISFLDTNQSFSEKAIRIQQVEQKMWDVISLYDAIKQEITVKYPSEFDVVSKTEKNKILQDMLLVTESNTAKKIIYMNMFKLNVKASDKELEEIENELDESLNAVPVAPEPDVNPFDEEEEEAFGR